MLTVRQIPDFEGIARTLEDFFLPEDVMPNEIVFRKGRIESRESGTCTAAFFYGRPAHGGEDIRLFRVLRQDDAGEWVLSQGTPIAHFELHGALEQAIGRVI